MLTIQEKLFLKQHNISEDDVFDARHLRSSERKDAAKKLGKNFMIAARCEKGDHRIRTRSNACIQCNHQAIQQQKRSSKTGNVYIAGSKSKQLIKIGFATDIAERQKTLKNLQHASCSDWLVLKYSKTNIARQLESEIQRKLSTYMKSAEYLKQGRWQPTREVFSCSFITALQAFDECCSSADIIEEKEIDLKFFKAYCDFPNIEQANL